MVTEKKVLTQNDRFRGALVGVLAGDALGAPYETWKAADVVADLEKRGGLVGFDYPNPWFGKTEDTETFPMGRPTDDSDHTAALAQSLLASNGLIEADLFYRLRDIVVNHKSPLWNGKALGAGGTTRKMLAPATYSESQALSSEGAIPTNGSTMRAAPMALYFAAKHGGQVNERLISQMSSVTHRNPLSGECCFVYISILAKMLVGMKHEESIARTADYPGLSQVMNDMLDNVFEHPRDPWPHTGAALLSLHVSLWTLLTTTSFRDGITKVVALGGDTDTYGAIAGGLLGAHYGLSGIPQDWQDILIGKDVMIHLADEFCIMANENAR